ncbi:MAG: hypothetical protein CAPSK01_001707 [Candidatus Accumulibacter vicinus]|uniref:Uncharacterized protein n=1 Tax=Candidatus Accumulibacter vicinus TaxID=2954382 RepID=A0A084Y2A8_9PROT|nr:MAG: hypothetical protein CAPSK01_001707 [Candidatus Accumulibacter vicinus]
MKIAARCLCSSREAVRDLRTVDEQECLGSIANRLEEKPVTCSDHACCAGYVKYLRRALRIEVDGAICVYDNLCSICAAPDSAYEDNPC